MILEHNACKTGYIQDTKIGKGIKFWEKNTNRHCFSWKLSVWFYCHYTKYCCVVFVRLYSAILCKFVNCMLSPVVEMFVGRVDIDWIKRGVFLCSLIVDYFIFVLTSWIHKNTNFTTPNKTFTILNSLNLYAKKSNDFNLFKRDETNLMKAYIFFLSKNCTIFHHAGVISFTYTINLTFITSL